MPDATGNNTGNWTAVFDSVAVNIPWTKYEIHRINVRLMAPGIFGWDVFTDLYSWEGFQSSKSATWADSDPQSIDSGSVVYFYFNQPTGLTPAPIVTIWVQVDPDLAKQQ